MRALKTILCLISVVVLAACGGSDSSTNGSSSSSTSSGGGSSSSSSSGGSSSGSSSSSSGSSGAGTLMLQPSDMPGVAPCPTQAILKNVSDLTAMKTALQNGVTMLFHLDKTFDGNPDIYKEKCGLEGFWDPSKHTDQINSSGNPITLANLFTMFNAGICSSNHTILGTHSGFPQAGTYHSEFKVSDMGMTWHGRVRYTANGSKAGARFVDEGITIPFDITNTFEYAIDGSVTPHANVYSGVVNALTASTSDAPSATLTVKDTAGGATIFTGKAELICVEKS